MATHLGPQHKAKKGSDIPSLSHTLSTKGEITSEPYQLA